MQVEEAGEDALQGSLLLVRGALAGHLCPVFLLSYGDDKHKHKDKYKYKDRKSSKKNGFMYTGLSSLC